MTLSRTAILLLFALAAAPASAANVDSYARLRELFPSPPAEFSTLPFLVWNGEVTEKEIDLHLEAFHQQGVRGVFIHPRPGMITPYLSERWFQLCRHTVDKGRQLGMEVWLYDENSYPSGFAGGHVPAEMPESYNEGQGLVLEKDGSFRLAYYDKRAWHGGFSYVDLLRPGVTEKFIELTMKGYERSIGSEFGRTVPGIFTDEPNIVPPVRRNCIRWTPDLFPRFRERWGYELKPHLPSLFQQTGDWRKVRHNYYALLLELFIERWSKPWKRYAEQHNLKWTGHYWEHGWPSPADGPDNMAMYAWHHVPGIDMLFNQFNEGVNAQFGNVRAVKELASVANQLGLRRTLSETYGGAGWELRFQDMKRLGDWEYALGVNMMNQHLAFQTLAGARKHDYPQSFTYHTPWWPQYRILADYFTRLSLALASGEQVNRILVIEPTTSAWMYASSGEPDRRMMGIAEAFQAFITRLEHGQVEYDLASENILKDHARAGAGKFTVGRRAYDLVVLPPGVENLDSPTVAMLERYLESGGRVASAAGAPARVDGAESPRCAHWPERFRSWIALNPAADPATVKLFAEADFSLAAESGSLLHQRRRMEGGQLLFAVNTSLETRTKARLKIPGRWLAVLDPETGRIAGYPARREGGMVSVVLDLPPAGSLLLFAGTSGEAPPAAARPPAGSPVAPAGPLEIRRHTVNAVTLDYCDLTLGGRTEKSVYYYAAADKVYKYHGFQDGNPWNTAVQYKTNILDRGRFEPGSGFEAAFRFLVAAGVNRTGMRAVVERPRFWKVSINGKALESRSGEWWLDREFGVFDIGPDLVDGENVLTLAAKPMCIHCEIEPVYITGDFSVTAQDRGWKIVPATELKLGAWKEQSLPFYSHTVSYGRTYTVPPGVTAAFVRVGKWNGTVVEVQVNGKSAGVVGWAPWKVDVSRLITPGSNRVEVIVYGSLKNLLGPHHGKINRGLVSPWSFRSAPETLPAGSGYDLDSYGLMEDFEVVALR